jgi:hypothetical protein
MRVTPSSQRSSFHNSHAAELPLHAVAGCVAGPLLRRSCVPGCCRESVADCCGMAVCSYSVDAWGSWAEGIRSAGLRKGQQVVALNYQSN